MNGVRDEFRVEFVVQERAPDGADLPMVQRALRVVGVRDVFSARFHGVLYIGAFRARMPDRRHDAELL